MRTSFYPAGGEQPVFPAAASGPFPAPRLAQARPVAPPEDFPRLVGLLAGLRWQAALQLPTSPFGELSEESSAAIDASASLIRLCDGLGWSEAVGTELARYPQAAFR
ncbi:MAG: hypothetical protein ABI047_10575 [Jatrophihabitantaceae bacterium]